ncbi:hypothetical protein LTR56_007483 [Elasticomyces elasticus]|nr:hypothetical protein LTR56_007483 [Elasticomyces elasticus]KAK3668195.1 hypothetical protein LTR22_000880 [Elasticomyces elasticus]KAK4921359.1 hypothetical protein LTR49_011189 [Elasticomyces elasticus]KAK5769478.1 hypothetical protein LTS12_000405 [Elasticomyces elasticus]
MSLLRDANRDQGNDLRSRFPHNPFTKIIIKRDFDVTQDQNKRHDRAYNRVRSADYVADAFPKHKVVSFMVCKDFFVGAASAYIGAQHWNTDQLGLPSMPCALLCQFATTVEVRSHCLRHLHEIPRIRFVTLRIGDQMFSNPKPEKYAWNDDLDETDFGPLKVTRRISRLRNIKSLSFVPGPCAFSGGPRFEPNVKIWKRNVQALEDYVRPIVTQPKASRSSKPRSEALRSLYKGSRVALNGGILLPPLPPRTEKRRVQIVEVEDGLTDRDVPDSEEQLHQLLKNRGPDLMAWIQAKKDLAPFVHPR